MGNTAGIKRNLEQGGGLYINHWKTGVVQQRSPLFTPISAMGVQLISALDALWDGLNVEITRNMTLQRRFGFSKTCLTPFASNEIPQAYFSFKNLSGTIKAMVDTNVNVSFFSSGANLIPDPDGTLGTWTGDAALVYSSTGGLAGSGGKWTYTGTGSAAGFLLRQSQTFNVVPGVQYTLSGYVDATHVTGGGPVGWFVIDPTLTTDYAFASKANGTSGRTTATFTVPLGVTQVVVIFDTENSTVANGQPLIFSNPQLEIGSSASTYINTSILSNVFVKTSSAQISFAKWQNTVYMCNGNDSDLKKWDGTTVTKFGIAAPVTAPTLSLGAGSLTTVNGGYQYVFVFKNPTTGQPSTASPVSASTGNFSTKNITVQGASSSDGQVTKVDIYRTKDGGSVYYFLAEVNNGGTWSYTDSTADTGLNTDLVAPLAHVNDPPPSGMSLVVAHMGRLWGASGGTLYYSGGPDITNGVGPECWPPGNNFPVPGKITALASTTGGLVVFTSDDAYIVFGEDSSTFTVPQIWQQNFGVASQNCVVQDGDLIFIFTTKGQLFQFGGNLQEIGWNIQSALGSYNPANVYLALHRSGPDEGLFVSDGSTNVHRYSMALGCWSTVFQPVGGVGAIGSIEVSTTNWRLLMGRTAGSGYILNRNTSVFSDDGTSYAAFAIVGSLVVAPPRQVAIINSVLLEASATGTYPTIAVLLNEISGTFTALPNPVPDPPELKASLTVRMMRHDFKAAQAPLPQHLRHMQVKITFATEAAQNEIYGLGLA